MSVIAILEFPGVTQALYDRVGARLGTSGAPAGILYHACGPAPGGWRIIGVWESEADFDRFTDSVYNPVMKAEGGPEPSRREAFRAYHAGAVVR